MIYGRFGDQCRILRLATLEDVRKVEQRAIDVEDERHVANQNYVLCEYVDDGSQFVAHVARLRADGSIKEIQDAIDRTRSL